jgi:hypothetical protein
MKKAIVFIMLMLAGVCYADTLESNFNDGTIEDWSATGASVAYNRPPGWPDGNLIMEDADDTDFIAVAPTKFAGNLVDFENGVLSYQVQWLYPTMIGELNPEFGRVRITGTTSEAEFKYEQPVMPSMNVFSTYTVPLSAKAFGITPAEFEKVMADVVEVNVMVEPENESWIAFDNFKLETPIELDINIRLAIIYLNQNMVVPVVVRSTPEFDALDVDTDTVTLAGASPFNWRVIDGNKDGLKDWIFWFHSKDMLPQIQTLRGRNKLTLIGKTIDDKPVCGIDYVRIRLK